MNIRRFANELCWFGASVLALAAFGLVIAWFDAGTAYPLAPARDALLIMSAGALVVMVVLIALACSSEWNEPTRKS
ncbi:MAG: hypothetical protein ACXWCY_20595 [Burkholderiales bacterium]